MGGKVGPSRLLTSAQADYRSFEVAYEWWFFGSVTWRVVQFGRVGIGRLVPAPLFLLT